MSNSSNATQPISNIYSFLGHNWKTASSIDLALCDSGNQTALVIDNGSYECRAGISSQNEPCLVFKNVSLKLKGKKENNEPEICLVGPDIENVEAVRSQIKSAFDRNVVTQFDAQESVLDYIFSKLSISGDGRVPHPIMMLEPVCNPGHCRRYMSELLFECYNVPSVAYGVDAFSSWYSNYDKTMSMDTGLIISCGYQTIHIIPVVQGNMELCNVRRISVGGYHMDYFMQRLLQLKYPIHAPAITLSKCEEILQRHSRVACDYGAECNQWLDLLYYDKMVRRLQLPYNNVPSNFAAVALQGERQAERARLVKEKQTLEKLCDKQHVLDQLVEIGELTGTNLYRRLAELGVDSIGELQCHMKAVKASSEDLKRKLYYKEEYNNGSLTEQWLQKKIDLVDNPESNNASLAHFDVAEYYQLHVGIEQIRVPELLFQPSMMGIDQAGISETVDFVIKKFDLPTQNLLATNVLLTGSSASLPGLKERVECDLRSVRPFKATIGVRVASSPRLDAWKGAAQWLQAADRSESFVTKAVYEERGGDFIRRHALGNSYCTPTVPT